MTQIKMLVLFVFTLNILLLGTFDDHLDTLGGVDVLECLLGVLELDTTCDELLHAQAARGDKIDGQLVVAGSIPKRSNAADLFRAHSHDGKVDVRLAHTSLDVGAAGSQCMDGSLYARFGSRGINDGICAESEVALFVEETGVLLRADSLRAEDVSGSVLLSKRKTLLVDVYGNNLGGAKPLGDGHAEKTNRTCTEDNNALARLDVSLLGDVHTDTQWLDQGGFLERNVVCDLVTEVLGEAVVLGEGAIVGRGGCKGHVNAKVVPAFSAADASAARHARLHGDTVTLLECCHLISYLLNDTSRLVTQYHGGLDYKVSNSTVCPVVHVRSADTGVLDVDDDIVGISELRNWAILKLDAVGLLENK